MNDLMQGFNILEEAMREYEIGDISDSVLSYRRDRDPRILAV